MAGIYLHIPFCKQACHYCNFHFSTSLKLQNDFLPALLKEIEIRKPYLDGDVIKTIYFGGGTPSLLPASHLDNIMAALYQHFDISASSEITFEANPDDIDKEKLNTWKNAGINRLSIGIQSFFEEDLVWMNRAHNATQALNCVEQALEAGFPNFSIDLIYGTPQLSDERWLENLARAAGLKIPHLSCYALTVEPGTALDAMTKKKKSPMVSHENQARQFLLMSDYLQSHGYLHYEISNLALPGKKSIHNSSYWSGEKYIGLGPSAHSFNGVSRQWNVSNNALYIQSLMQEELSFELETLTEVQKLNEYIMTSLRLMEGTDLNHIRNVFGEILYNEVSAAATPYIKKEWIEESAGRLVLTREGKLFADGIAADLFVTG